MPQVKKQEEPISPASLSGAWRSSLSQLHIYQDRPAPVFAFLVALALWAAGISRIAWPQLTDPEEFGVCLLPDALFRPHSSEWRRYLLHALWPFESSYIRPIFTSAALLLQGYAFEYEVGTLRYAALFLGLHVASSAVLLHYRFAVCHVGIESTLAALAAVIHRANPKIHTDGLDISIRVEWPVEPRWHIWAVMSLLLLMASNFAAALPAYGVGLVVGGVCALRDPDAWQDAWKIARSRSPAIGRAVHVALFMFVMLFVPLTTPGAQASVLSAILDGRALSLNWWRSTVPSSPPLLHLAVSGLLGSQALWICRLLVSFVFPLLLSPYCMWTRVYSAGLVILLMYTMNSAVWQYPHLGFVALFYLIWAFWTLPNVQPVGYKTA